ncbi:uncharacterized protein LOC128365440, partial [Scomber scombrus]
MTALLTEQRVEIRQLQRENEAQAAKLEGQKTEVDNLKQEISHLQRDNEAHTAELIIIKDRMNVTENQVETLKRDGEAYTSELITIQSRTNVTENQVETLKRDGEAKQVAFSASLLASGYGHVGPFNTQTALVFRHVVTNIGKAYNPNT